ncbi:hypothetical protein [Kangiella sp. TOML190]|uniref:hypothetical protein n=1 Tax=Kangiella sp. TOML190 TaxID=2931351 RepID=UPI00203E5F46|nr:hypothetical protein [Kangiella sp. TOML190]
MSQDSFQVVNYQYYHWSSRNSGKTNLNLEGVGGKRCSVWFEEDPEAELAEAHQIAPNVYSFCYHHHQLAALIDMLRNEKPVYVYFNNDNGFNNSRISTNYEPVGEGEES